MTEPITQLALLGASGHGKVVADAALCAGWGDVVFFDDAWPAVTMNGHWPVVGNSAALLARAHEFGGVIVSIGNAAVRFNKQLELQAAGARLATIIHPRACVSRFARIGMGSVVMAGAVVNADATIGNACIINTGSSVDHDCDLADGVHISPGAHLAGNVAIGANSWVGVGAAVRQGIRIGESAMVGAGAVVVKPVADRSTVVGNPAAPLPPN
jgi:sugar O-acyltransferase (sialic acid O-acetyltransferase NeuD family)